MKASDILALVVSIVIILLVVRRISIREGEKGLVYKDWRLTKILEPGTYWYFTIYTRIVRVDTRLKYKSFPGQDIITKDGITLRTTSVASYAFKDIKKVFLEIEDIETANRIEIQLILRDLMSSLEVDEVIEKRSELNKIFFERAKIKLETLGLELKSLEIKDITYPGELKKIFNEVLSAKKQGMAALEKARAETAALRSLANAAKMLEGNPMLLQLRILQAVGNSSGNKIVLSGIQDSPQQHVTKETV